MKKTLLIVAALCVAGISQAQDNKFWIGGSAQFNNYSDDGDTKITGGNFSPSFGFSINPKIAVGIGLNYQSTTTKEKNSTGDTEQKNTEFGVMPFFRYYKSIGDKCSLYGEVNVGFGSGKSKYTAGSVSTEDTYSYIQAGIAPGIQYWFHNNWSVNAEWGALRYRGDNDKGDYPGQKDFKSSNIAVGLDLSSITFGLNFHF